MKTELEWFYIKEKKPEVEKKVLCLKTKKDKNYFDIDFLSSIKGKTMYDYYDSGFLITVVYWAYLPDDKIDYLLNLPKIKPGI